MSNFPSAGVYTIDPVHSTLTFVARHLVVSKVRGRFADFAGTITVGEGPESSSAEVTVQAASITTDNEMRDNHIRSNDFLAQETYPTLTFKSTSLSPKGGNEYALTGDLTLRDVTKSVTFNVEFMGEGATFQPGQNVIGFEGTAEIDRRDFNVNFEGNLENGAAVVSHKIVIEIAVEAVAA